MDFKWFTVIANVHVCRIYFISKGRWFDTYYILEHRYPPVGLFLRVHDIFLYSEEKKEPRAIRALFRDTHQIRLTPSLGRGEGGILISEHLKRDFLPKNPFFET